MWWCWPGSWRWPLEEPMSSNITPRHAIQAWGILNWLWENFYNHITHNILSPISPDCNRFDYHIGHSFSRDQQTPCNTKDELKTRITSTIRCLWCNGYRRSKWTQRYEFKSWTRLIAFHIALIPLGKVWIQLFSLQLWVNSRADWVL